ncbi:MAG: hypothetical protein WC054_00030 [Candidatus Nanopelagicales bacterium]
MTNTGTPAPTETEISVCDDCRVLIANDDDSGVSDEVDLRYLVSSRWSGYLLIVLNRDTEDEPPFVWDGCCDACGRDANTLWDALAVPSS